MISPPAGAKTMPSMMNIKMWNDVNGIIQSKNAMATKITTIVDTGRPIRSTINAPNGSAGMNSQLVKLTIAPAEDSSTPFDTRYSGSVFWDFP